DGTVLTRSGRGLSLPTITFDRRTPARLHRLGPPAWILGAMGDWLRSRVAGVQETSTGDFVLHLASGVPVYYGDAAAVQQKDQALAAVLKWAVAGGHSLVSVDVQAPVAPTARLDVYVPPSPPPARSASTPNASPPPVKHRSGSRARSH